MPLRRKVCGDDLSLSPSGRLHGNMRPPFFFGKPERERGPRRITARRRGGYQRERGVRRVDGVSRSEEKRALSANSGPNDAITGLYTRGRMRPWLATRDVRLTHLAVRCRALESSPRRHRDTEAPPCNRAIAARRRLGCDQESPERELGSDARRARSCALCLSAPEGPRNVAAGDATRSVANPPFRRAAVRTPAGVQETHAYWMCVAGLMRVHHGVTEPRRPRRAIGRSPREENAECAESAE
jgi:hypothetical protein